MPKEFYIGLTIALTILLIVIFFVSFLLYVKTKPPKGCENLGRDESKCGNCKETSCRFYHLEDKLQNKDKGE